MPLRRSAYRASDQQHARGTRDVHGDRRWYRRRCHDGDLRACRLVGELSGNASGDEKDEPIRVRPGLNGRAEHLVDRVVPADVLCVEEQGSSVSESGGVDPSQASGAASD